MAVNIRRMTSTPPPGGRVVKDWKGKRVRLLRDMQNGWAVIPAGALATVDRVGGGVGLTLKIDPCTHCGARLYISKVHTSSVELVS